ncbi:DUF4175 domain-containing protein [Insolitispirillum peregrinum]|uniref:TIGR02302 family protein n=1 Tax=Insolitispirillum peregrinum TaxID=80876 RepID=A0A1N7JAA9_9PROT|nr:DUF4175 family protein [Insolitispirillum peregrinum]SIS46230.1 TIGR02302 family protein [Insolitispirillum peregrinum]
MGHPTPVPPSLPDWPALLGPEEGRRLLRRLALCRLALWAERLTAALWSSLTLAGLVLALFLSDGLRLLPGWLHAVVLLAVVIALGLLLVGGLRRLRRPTPDEVLAFAEGTTPHQPLTALRDSPLTPLTADPLTAALWQLHQQRMLAAVRALPLRWPRPVLPEHDPWGLRVLPALALVVVAPLALDDPLTRLARAFQPTLSWGSATEPATATVWLTPPAYTGLPPVQRSTRTPAEAPVRVPEGSHLLVLVQGAEHPVVRIDSVPTDIPPVSEGTGSHRLDLLLTSESSGEIRLEIRDGRHTIASWPLEITKDRPPQIVLVDDQQGPPPNGPGGVLQEPYLALDDYGLTSVTAEVTGPDGRTRQLSLPVPTARREAGKPLRYQGQARLDLASDPLAGQDVDLRLLVQDAAGSVSATATVRRTIPERVFHNPLAREVAEWRRRLLADYAAIHLQAAEGLYQIGQNPAIRDFASLLGLRVAASALSAPDSGRLEARDASLLWAIALRLEDGDRADAEQALAAAEKALDDAIAANADPQTIAERVDALRQAVQDYMQAVLSSSSAAYMMHQGEAVDLEALGSDSPQMDLDAMLQQLRALEEAGAREAADALREKIRQSLQALRSAQAPDPAALKAMAETMQQLTALARQQQELLDSTFSKSTSDPSDDAASEMQAHQTALRDKLLDTMAKVAGQAGGAAPPSLGQAEQAMQQAGKALGQGQWSKATDWQGKALEALQQGRQQAQQQMLQAMGGGKGMMVLPGGGRKRAGGNGPLQNGPAVDDGTVKVPATGDVSRGREILLELRRRANDLSRPQDERDYIHRLLQQF